MTRERGERLRNVKEQKWATLSATNGTKVAGLARINSFWALRDAGIDRRGDRRVGRKTIDSPALGCRHGEKVGRKDEGQARANRLSSRGLRASDPGISPSLFLLSLHHFFLYLSAYPSPRTLSLFLSLWPRFATMRNYPALRISDHSSISRQCRRCRTINC